ncbi:High-affinity zinc uptake system protein ZnuA [Phycisphaerales bacterium]|nr:High-affinity zinc uptake system protein ZnuA [Phycisphaerales bacterium]
MTLRLTTIRLALFVGALIAAFASFALGQRGQTAPLNVVVTVAPLRGIIEPLLPPGSKITILMPPGRSEHGYEFSSQDLSTIAKSDLVFYVGLGLEPRLEQALKKEEPQSKRIEICFATALGIKSDGHEDHDEEPGDDHDTHDHAIDQHLWLDPVLVKRVVPHLGKAVKNAVVATGGAEVSAETDKRAQDLAARVAGVDEAWRARLEPFKGRAIVTHHNAFPRPAQRYGLRIAAVIRGLENAEPTAAKIEGVVRAIREEKVAAIFVEPQYNARLAERIAREAQVKVARIDPIGDGDWFSLMEQNLESLVTNLGTK